MARNYLTERDLMEDLRLKSHETASEVKEARIERSGDLSVIPFDKTIETCSQRTPQTKSLSCALVVRNDVHPDDRKTTHQSRRGTAR